MIQFLTIITGFLIFLTSLFGQDQPEKKEEERIRLTPTLYSNYLENGDEKTLNRFISLIKELNSASLDFFENQEEESPDQRWLEDMNSIAPSEYAPIKLRGVEFSFYRVASGHYKRIFRKTVEREIAFSPSKRLKIEEEAREFYRTFSKPFRADVFAIRFPGYWIGHPEETQASKVRIIGERIEILRLGDAALSNELMVQYRGHPFLGIILTYIPGFDELEGTVHFGSKRGSEEEESGGMDNGYEGRGGESGPWNFIRNVGMIKEMREKKFPEERWYDITVDLKIGTGLSAGNYNPFRRILIECMFDFARNKQKFFQSSLELEYNPPQNFKGDGEGIFFIYFLKTSF